MILLSKEDLEYAEMILADVEKTVKELKSLPDNIGSYNEPFQNTQTAKYTKQEIENKFGYKTFELYRTNEKGESIDGNCLLGICFEGSKNPFEDLGLTKEEIDYAELVLSRVESRVKEETDNPQNTWGNYTERFENERAGKYVQYELVKRLGYSALLGRVGFGVPSNLPDNLRDNLPEDAPSFELSFFTLVIYFSKLPNH